MTANGECILASENENSDLFRTLPMSYGTFGFLTRITIRVVSWFDFGVFVVKYWSKNGKYCSGIAQKLVMYWLDQGGRGWLAFVHLSRIPQSFRRARISQQKHRFIQLREYKQFVVVKRLTHKKVRSHKHPFRCLGKYFHFTKLLFYENFPKAS